MALPPVLEGFQFKVVIDWIRIEVKLSSPSQFRHVQSRMSSTFGKTYVKPCEGQASSNVFAFRVQNPQSADQFMEDVQSMRRPHDPPIREEDVRITGIEVSLDAYLAGSDRSRLAAAAFHFMKHQAQRPDGNARITQPKHFRAAAHPPDTLQALEAGYSVHVGAKDDDYRVRAYLKDYDTVDGEQYKPLPPEKHRARFEVVLEGAAVSFTSIDAWRYFRFEKLAPRFAMCIPVATDGLAAVTQPRMVLLGRAADSPKRRPSDRRKRSPYTRRDSITNDKIRQALRGLTRAQSCRNSVRKEPDRVISAEGKARPEVSSPKYFMSTSSEEKDSSLQQGKSGMTTAVKMNPSELITTTNDLLVPKVFPLEGSEAFSQLATEE